jgi:hypothetical protein
VRRPADRVLRRRVVRACIESAVGTGWPARRPRLRLALFGDTARPVSLDPAWLTSAVVAIARQVDDASDYSAMPILADALQDAGCDDEDVLAHCRGAGPHVRGCWVVDLLLGKE